MKTKLLTALKFGFCWVIILSTVLSMLVLPTAASEIDKTQLETVTLDENATYNGMVLPANWKTHKNFNYGNAPSIPYLKSKADGGYHPDVINIDVGRQLFVDNFLIDSTTLTQTYHNAEIQEEPVFIGDAAHEFTTAVMISGGMWYDMEESIYKMWYSAGFCGKTAYATSKDGINWERYSTSADGSNIVLKFVNSEASGKVEGNIASNSVWIDYEAPESERYKMMARQRDLYAKVSGPGVLYTSSNGIAWKKVGETGGMGDRSTFYYDCFQQKWVFSIRYNSVYRWGTKLTMPEARCRAYHDGDTWLEAAKWNLDRAGIYEFDPEAPLKWLKTDSGDPIDQTDYTVGDDIPELYNFDAIGYESIMLGMYQIWYGPHNDTVHDLNVPKITEIQAAYSRDGYNYDRPVRGVGEGNAFIPASRVRGEWDCGYLSTATGGIIVYDDEIRIYYSAISGEYFNSRGELEARSPYAGGSVGYATIRRDGFASMDGTGELLTNDLTVTKDVKYLFVNANVEGGSLKAEILDTKGNVVKGYSAADCVAFTGDDCCTKLTWNGADDLSFLQGKGFRIRFVMENGELYSFWLSDDEEGYSGGALGAGYAGEKDFASKVLPEEEETTDTTETTAPETDGETTEGTDSEPSDDANEKGCASALGSGMVILLPAMAAALFLKKKRRS